jgi:hypothetical protein
MMVLMGGAEEQAAIQWKRSIWLRRRENENIF